MGRRSVGAGGAASLLAVLLLASGCEVPQPYAVQTTYSPGHPAAYPYPRPTASVPAYRSPRTATRSTPDTQAASDFDAPLEPVPALAPPPPAASAAPAAPNPKPPARSEAASTTPRPAAAPAADAPTATPASTEAKPRARVPLGGFRPLPTYGNGTTGS